MVPNDQLTSRQREVFELIREMITNRGYGPTVREIGDHFGIRSPNGVMCHLKALEKKGFIYRSPNKSRAIEITAEVQEAERGLPLVGVVAAGAMELAFEQNERIEFDDLFHGSDQFVLEVRGDSMVDAHISSGDYVVVKKQSTARAGQMVVAQTEEGEATLKYWHPESNRIRLQPANAEMEPIFVTNASVLGIVVGVVRSVN
ncbi:MAG TPA: repressor LexA [Planctomycetaceae bacterium]|nr:repressor LexA [Planctomycetaceae bacterium]